MKMLSLAELEASDPGATRGAAKAERRFCCPLCGAGKKQNTAHRSLSLNSDTGVYRCHRCQASGKVTEFCEARNGRRTPEGGREGARRALQRAFGPSAEPSAAPTTPLSSEDSQKNATAPQEARKAFSWRECYEKALPIDGGGAEQGRKYLEGRGLDIAVAAGASVRFTKYYEGTGAAVLFPICDLASELVAVFARSIQGSAKRCGGPKKEGAFFCEGALDKSLPALIVCEAPIDALALATCGFPAIALNGCDAPALLRRAVMFQRVLLATDADAAGDKAAQVLAETLPAHGARCARLRPEVGKDWNEELQALGVDGLADWLARHIQIPPQVLEPASTCSEVPEDHDARLQLSREIGGILEALPGAKRLRSGDWRIESELWEHDQAVILAAQRRGSTTGGFTLSPDDGSAHREDHSNDTREVEEHVDQ